MAATQSLKKSGKAKGAVDQEKIVLQFNQLRQECRNIMSKLGELEMDSNEHSVVAETLKGVEPHRRCFRMVGGVLVERTVEDVLPALIKNKEQIDTIIEKLREQLTSKEADLAAFRDKYNIRVRGERDNSQEHSQAADKSSGVLVAQEKSKTCTT